ncbi:HNH endonuclease signature motif containing protein, partial [Weissella fermenti]
MTRITGPYEYKGKTYKTQRDLTDDYNVNLANFSWRLRHGRSVTEAMNDLLNPTDTSISYNGQIFASQSALAKYVGVKPNSLSNCLKVASSTEEAVEHLLAKQRPTDVYTTKLIDVLPGEEFVKVEFLPSGQPVKTHQGQIFVSNMGRVAKRKLDGIMYLRTLRIVHPNGKSYYEMSLSYLDEQGELKHQTVLVHRVVYQAFFKLQAYPKTGYVVHHIDGDSLNNRLDNLTLTDQKYNSIEPIAFARRLVTDYKKLGYPKSAILRFI